MFRKPLDLRKALIAFGAGTLVVLGLGVIIYFGVARNRLTPTPTSTPTATVSAALTLGPTKVLPTPTQSASPIDMVAGIVEDYSPGALIIVIEPTEGEVDQVIVQENLEVIWESGLRASPMDILPGQHIYAEGILDSLERLVANLIIIMEGGPEYTPMPTLSVSPTSTPTPDIPEQAWRGEYYANRFLSGYPVMVRQDGDIDFQWENLGPGPSVPADRFSVRWEGIWRFDDGLYSFIAYTDDGVRLWVDDQLVIDRWQDQSATLASSDLYVEAGQHLVRVEYYEGTGQAEARVFWEQRISTRDWQARYYDNPDLQGDPVVERRDSELTFNWGLSAPTDQLPVDGFSARWIQSAIYEEGAYRFKVRADDGVRLWVDDTLIIDEWHVAQQATYVGYAWLSADPHEVRVEYYEGEGDAYLQVWRERITTYAYWQGTYYGNAELAEPPQFARDDRSISFDWRQGSPGFGIPEDNFSVRWTRRIDFDYGYYNFWAIADDGVRLYVDDHRIIDAWQDSSSERYDGAITIQEGRHKITVEYYERGGQASIQVGWERSSTATPTPTLAPTLTPSASPTPTGTPTQTTTSTPIVSTTPTGTTEPTASATPTATGTPSPTDTTGVPSVTPSVTPSLTTTPTATEAPTATVTATETITETTESLD